MEEAGGVTAMERRTELLERVADAEDDLVEVVRGDAELLRQLRTVATEHVAGRPDLQVATGDRTVLDQVLEDRVGRAVTHRLVIRAARERAMAAGLTVQLVGLELADLAMAVLRLLARDVVAGVGPVLVLRTDDAQARTALPDDEAEPALRRAGHGEGIAGPLQQRTPTRLHAQALAHDLRNRILLVLGTALEASLHLLQVGGDEGGAFRARHCEGLVLDRVMRFNHAMFLFVVLVCLCNS